MDDLGERGDRVRNKSLGKGRVLRPQASVERLGLGSSSDTPSLSLEGSQQIRLQTQG